MYRLSPVLLCVVLFGPPLHAATYYVDIDSTNDALPYADWTTAATNIQEAVDEAGSNDTVLVADGTYPLAATVLIAEDITLRSVNGAASTVLDGGGSVQCVRIEGTVQQSSGAVVDGFTITRGLSPSDGRGGAAILWRGGTVQNCVISNNLAFASDVGKGGGVYVYYSGTVRNCLVTHNSAFSDPFPSLQGEGGGVCILGFGAVEHCTVVSNSAASEGGGVRTSNGSIVLNSIATSNSAPEGTNWYGPVSVFDYCCTTPDPGGAHNVTADPQLVDFAGGNYRLQAGSPCIDAGTNLAHVTRDLDGVARPLDGDAVAGAQWDIGAYEFDSSDPDADDDGMADAWEMLYFKTLDRDGTGDYDRDGWTDLQEHDNGTDPTKKGPNWWYTLGVINTNAVATNDYAVVNAGQLKWIATQAYRAATNSSEWTAAAGEEAAITNLVGNFSAASDYRAVNIGQVKYVAQPFYDWLIRESVTNEYPWIGAATTNDYGSANIGQVKSLFSFPVPE